MTRRLVAAFAISSALVVTALAAAPGAPPAAAAAAAPRLGEIGRPFLSCISARDYHGTSQNWVFAQDSRGLLYLGNTLGVLEYDGASWRLIETAVKSVVRAITKDEHGRLYVGSTGDFGYLGPDASGQLQYVSLLPNVAPEDRAFNDVWTALATPQGVYFQSREILLRVTPPADGATTGWLVRSWKPKGRFLYAFWIGGMYYVHQEGVGLQRMVGDTLELVPGSEQFAAERVQILLPLSSGSSTDLLLGTFNRGLFRYDGRTFQPFVTDADAYLRERTLYKGLSLPDGTFALATISGGVVIVDPRGHALRYINQQTGLPNDNGLAIFVDRSALLWIAPEGAVCHAETPSPLTRFDIRVGLSGTVADVVRHKGVLYVATGVGVFYLDAATSTFKQVTGFREGNSQSNGLASNGDVLVAGYGSGLHQIDGAVAHLVKPNVGASFSAGALRFSKQDPHRLWVALEDGLATLHLDASGHWVDDGRIPGVRETLNILAEPTPGTLWLGTNSQGTLRVRFHGASIENPQIDRYGKAAGLAGDNGVSVYTADDRPVFVQKQGVFRFDDRSQRFSPDATFAGIAVGGTQDESALAQDVHGDVWANFGKETAVFRRQASGSYVVDKTALLRFSDLAVSKIYSEPDGVVWFGRDDGLIRYDPSVPKNYSVDYSVLIRRITTGDGRVIFGGAGGTSDGATPTLPAGDNALRFEFAATSYEDVQATQYQSMLEGFDTHWSAWSSESRRDYTNLPPKAFRFRVRARNLYQHDSSEATYALAIAAPWYATWWSYTLYAVAGLAVILGAVGIRTRNLRAEGRRLERVIAERTQEIRDREAEVRTQAEELKTIDDIVKVINREEGLKNVLHALLEQGMKLVPQAQKAAFLIRDLTSDQFVFASHTGYPADQFKGVSLSENEVTQRYAEGTERVEKGVYIVRPVEHNGRAPIAGLQTPKSMVAMTVALRGRLEGLLVFDNLDDPDAFNHSDLQRLTRLREHAIGAVAKARTLVTVQEKTVALQQQKEQIEQAYDNVELLSRIGRDITAKLSIEEIIDTVYANVNSLMDAAVFGIGLYNEEDKRLDFPATKENGVPLPPFSYALDDESRMAVVCFQRRQEIVIEDMPREHSRYIKNYKPPVAGQPVASLFYLPLLYKEHAIGVITAQSFRKHAYTDYHLNILRNLATYATIALENADAYRRLTATLDRLKATQEQLVVQEKLASLGALTAGIAHEIKNPLNFVNNFAELSVELAQELLQEIGGLKDRIEPADFELLQSLATDLQMNARKINEHGRRADSIVRGMLLHSRGQSGERQDTDLNALLEEYVNLSYHGMRAQDSSFNLTVERDYDPSIGSVRVVPQDLSRVFLNLVNNACYATHEKSKTAAATGQRDYAPTLRVSTKNAGETVEVRVRDNGDGIPKDIRDRIFNPFFTTKPTGQGTGLGLSISHDIVVQQHHGTLDVDSVPGQYTEFVIRLPRLSAAAAAEGEAALA